MKIVWMLHKMTVAWKSPMADLHQKKSSVKASAARRCGKPSRSFERA
ncbi:MAG: hypothetical protein WAL95_21335 [Candidatus Acidiferrales bacterium]